MYLKAKRGKEVTLSIVNRIGVLAEMAKVMADRGVNLLAINASVDGSVGTIRLVTDDNLRAKDVLREHGYNPHEEDVIMLTVPHKAGMLHRVTEILAEAMIDTHHVYATTTETDGDCCVVLHTANDDQALVKLNEIRIGA